ncbi:MAG: excinuclease ABC subunit UvrC [Planctomycetes bacterium]|nr:excinuclease ABC subunit UvrC [Planctomycetota bacterium]MCB9889635.1 excinuclease ABC subunit UvrC [Planctomycetota bacterium]
MNPIIEDKVARFPEAPGVYIFLDAAGKALYVGKAARLRTRVRSYLKPGGDGRPQIPFLARRAADVEFLATRTEQEALLLENTVIKKRKPTFNVKLKDDKSFLLLRLDPRDPWPWFRLVRRRSDDGCLYFGPYASAKSVRRTLRLLHKVVPLRDCADGVFQNRARPCIKHQIGRCPAPCVGAIEPADYQVLLDDAVRILRGQSGPLLQTLQKRMTAAASQLEFERAQALKIQIEALARVSERQGVVQAGGEDLDALGLHRVGDEVTAVFLLFRDGKLESSRRFAFRSELPDALLLAELLGRFYEGDHYVPGEVLVAEEVDEARLVAEWLSDKRGGLVQLTVPKRGPKLAMLATAVENARLNDALEADVAARGRRAAAELGALLGAAEPPRTIHCLDVSTIQGRHTVASRVAFTDGAADKAFYRRFKISAGSAGNDFAAMEEAVRRSLTLCLTRDDEELPDLLLVDGGAGQVGAAGKALAELGLVDDLVLAGLAKSRRQGRGDEASRSDERLFLPGRSGPIALPRGGPVTLLVAAVRDEAHRFAITYHRQLRRKLTSALDEIEGVGPTRRRLLLRHFGSLSAVRSATRDQLMSVPGLPAAVGARVFDALR